MARVIKISFCLKLCNEFIRKMNEMVSSDAEENNNDSQNNRLN